MDYPIYFLSLQDYYTIFLYEALVLSVAMIISPQS